MTPTPPLCAWCGRPLRRSHPQYAHVERHYCKLAACQREYKRWLKAQRVANRRVVA